MGNQRDGSTRAKAIPRTAQTAEQRRSNHLEKQVNREDARRKREQERADRDRAIILQERERVDRLHTMNVAQDEARRAHLDDHTTTQLLNHVEYARREAHKRGEQFNPWDVARAGLSELRERAATKAGLSPTTAQPLPGFGSSGFDARKASREEYEARLRELGLVDPAGYSIPSGGGSVRHY